MPLCMLSREAALMGVTPVCNIFISDYMPSAPENYVKVYLYGLMLCHTSRTEANELSLALKMSEEEVTAAFCYWQELGLVTFVNADPPEVRYLSPLESEKSARRVSAGAEYTGLVRTVRALFGERLLSENELRRMIDWVEVFGMSIDCAEEVVRYCIGIKGRRVSMNYMDAVAKSWADGGVLTAEAAAEHESRLSRLTTGAQKLKKSFGSSRAVTDAELKAYEKWTKGWGFDEETIMAVAMNITGASDMNFAYLDRVLDGYRLSSAVSAEDIDKQMKRRDAAAELARQMFGRAKIKSAPTNTHIDQVERWLDVWELPPELILLAAENSVNASQPFAAIKKLITELNEKRIRSVSAAREYLEKRGKSNAAGNGKKPSRALSYTQRSYTDKDFADIHIDFSDEE